METIAEISENRSGAAQRLHAYLQCLGMDDDSVLRQLSEQILQLAGQRGNADDLEQAALDEIHCRKEAWFRALSDLAAQGNPSRPDPLAGWRLRMILRKNPDALLCQPALELCHAAAESGDTQPVPQAHESEMPTQLLEELPAGLQKEFWKNIASRLKKSWCKHAGHPPQEQNNAGS